MRTRVFGDTLLALRIAAEGIAIAAIGVAVGFIGVAIKAWLDLGVAGVDAALKF